MKRIYLAIIFVFMLSASVRAAAEPNTLTDDEKKSGWKLLFDGKTTEGWRGYKMEKMPPGWKVIDGALVRVAGGAGGKGAGGGDDVMTVDQYDNFEFKVDWRIMDKAGNSGIVIRAAEDDTTSWHTGPECQILDNPAYPGRNVKELAGACYDLYAPAKDVYRGLGQWNEARIVANGMHIEHWLNGTKMCEYEMGSPEWKKLVAPSKFKDFKHFKEPPSKGYIVLQDHTARLEFRNIKIRPLQPVETPQEASKRESGDRDVIKALRDAGANLAKPHALEHHFITYERDKADQVISDDLAVGYKASKISTLNDKNGKPYWYFDLIKAVVPQEQTVFAESLRMTTIAKKHGVEYDGWGCGVEK